MHNVAYYSAESEQWQLVAEIPKKTLQQMSLKCKKFTIQVYETYHCHLLLIDALYLGWLAPQEWHGIPTLGNTGR